MKQLPIAYLHSVQHTIFKIVHLIDRLEPGGAERILLTQSALFAAKGHTVHIMTTVSKGKLALQIHPEVKLLVLHRKWKYNPIKIWQLNRLLRQYNIIHIHGYHNMRYIWLALQIGGIKAKIFYQEHHGAYDETFAVGKEQKKILRTINFIAVSQSIVAWAIKQVELPTQQVFLLQNIILKHESKVQTVQATDTLQLLITANFTENKNILFAIELLHYAMQQSQKNMHLTIIGHVNDEAYYHSVLRYIDTHQLTKAITIKTGITNVQEQLYQYDMALHCSIFESGPLVLIEYLAHGLPFIASKTGEVVQQIQNDFPEFVAEDMSVEKWCDKIRNLATQNQNHLEEKMHACFDKHYSTEVYYQKCLHIYQDGV